MRAKNIIKWFAFSKELSGGSRSVFTVILCITPLGWLPTSAGLFFIHGWWDYLVFAIGYSSVLLLLYLFIGNRVVSKHATMNELSTIVCVALLMIQNGIMIYLYSYRILVSRSSLCITIPVSLLIAFIFVEFWIKISNKNRKNALLKKINNVKNA